MKYKTAFIILSIASMIGLIFYFALDKESKQYTEFTKDGYIFSSSNDNTSNSSVKYYFNSGSKYKDKYPSNIIFTDIDGNEVSVEDKGIVHYLDGSISVLEKSVIINTDDLSTKNLKYYNIFNQTILENKDGVYTTNNSNDKVSFTNFIVKVSDTRFLLVSKNLKLVTDSSEKNISGYLELNIIDGDIVRLENQEVSMQTIASNSYINLGDNVKLDLSNNKVYFDSKEKFSLSELVINSDDNIPIEVDEEAKETDTNNSSGNTSNSGTGNTGNNSTIDVGTNGNDYNDDDTEEVEDTVDNLPVFTVASMEVSSNKLSAVIKITDNSNMLIGNVLTKIVETNSGKVVYSREDSSGTFSLDISIENLNPNTGYTLIVNSDYIKDSVTYNRDFLIKSFRTELLGISMSKNYYTDSVLSFIVNAEPYSNIKSADVLLLDSDDKVIKTVSVDGEHAKSGADVIFDNLSANTSYKVVMANFLYEDVVISNGFEVEIECKTLKNKPTFGQITSIINKKDGTFTLQANNVSDVDHGIQSYKYEIYDARVIADKNAAPVATVEKTTLGSVDLKVDGTTIIRGVPYTFKLIAEFYDNEKYVEYESDYSSVFKMDGVEFPTLRFESSEITFEKIDGILTIIDEGNTISLDDSLITIVYTNSIGISRSITANGNLSIPLSLTNLRANETYTISVYTTVNLQDGNSVINNCFVGSVIVKTAETKALVANYSVNYDSITNAFSVNTILGTSAGIDNTLEANTLTGLVFNLYAGQTASGTLVKSVKKVDRNLSPYNSDLKENYYDKSFLITPEFFGVTNSDMHEEYYTIEITGAYDYTDYKNDIPITKQTVSVKSNGFIPDLPPDINNALEVNVIRNKDAGDKYRTDLKSDTVVGYKVKASYDNSRLYAKYLKYYIYDAKTNQVINPEGKIVEVDSTGIIDYATFYLNDGTEFSLTDNSFTRGNEYYFVYEAYLDLNFDGVAETVYPYKNDESGVVLKSSVVSPAKQEPIFELYPSTSTNNSMTFKYKFTDIDNAMMTDELYATMAGVEKSKVAIEHTTTDYKTITFSNLVKGNLSIEASQALIKTDDSVKRKSLVYQYFDSLFGMKALQFHATTDVNRVIISILNYDDNIQYTSRIAALKITFTSGGQTIIKDNVPLDYDSVTIDLAQIKEFINQDVTIGVQAYYDTGITGFDISGGKVALQTIIKDGVGGEYLTINSSNNLRGDISANGSIYNMDFNPNSIALSNLATSRTKVLASTCNETGIIYNYENLLAKKLDTSTLTGDGTQTINFDTIVPGVSLLNDQERLDISATLRTAQINLKFYGADASKIKDNKFYVELYQTNESGTTSTFINSTEVTVVDSNNTVNLSNLNPKTQYFIKLYADVYDGVNYVKTQLYDIDYKNNTKIYYFSTLSSVGITNMAARYVATTYNDKNIRVTYNLAQIVGYDKIKYTLYKYETDSNGIVQKVPVTETITDDVIFNKSMVKNIPCPPGSSFTFDQQYNLVITPIVYVTIDGKQVEVELDDNINYDFYLYQLRSPFIGIVGTATEDSGLQFKISVSDIHKVIVNGTYTIKIVDSNGVDVTPDKYKYVEYSINSLNNTITLTNLERAREYKIIVSTYIDRKNNMTDIERYESTYSKSTLDDSGIDLGDIYTAMNSSSKSKIDLLFYNSYKLTSISNIRYSIYNFSGYAQDGTISFIPSQITTGGEEYYLFTLPEILPKTGLYYIELQFLYEDRVVKTASIEHNYTDN